MKNVIAKFGRLGLIPAAVVVLAILGLLVYGLGPILDRPCDLGVHQNIAVQGAGPYSYLFAVRNIANKGSAVACYHLVSAEQPGEVLSWVEFRLLPSSHIDGGVYDMRGDTGWRVLGKAQANSNSAWIVPPEKFGLGGVRLAPYIYFDWHVQETNTSTVNKADVWLENTGKLRHMGVVRLYPVSGGQDGPALFKAAIGTEDTAVLYDPDHANLYEGWLLPNFSRYFLTPYGVTLDECHFKVAQDGDIKLSGTAEYRLAEAPDFVGLYLLDDCR